MRHYNRMSKKNQQLAGDLIQILQEKFPFVFPCKPLPKVALMVGIDKQLIAIKDELGVDDKVIFNALALWCQGKRYFSNLKVVGTPRFDLYGQQSGFVTERETMRFTKKSFEIDTKIEEMELSSRTLKMLIKAKINFKSELKERFDTLGEIMGMGKKSLEEIKNALNQQSAN